MENTDRLEKVAVMILAAEKHSRSKELRDLLIQAVSETRRTIYELETAEAEAVLNRGKSLLSKLEIKEAEDYLARWSEFLATM